MKFHDCTYDGCATLTQVHPVPPDVVCLVTQTMPASLLLCLCFTASFTDESSTLELGFSLKGECISFSNILWLSWYIAVILQWYCIYYYENICFMRLRNIVFDKYPSVCEMTVSQTKMGNLCNVICTKSFQPIRRLNLFGYHWIRAHATFGITCFPRICQSIGHHFRRSVNTQILKGVICRFCIEPK